jgi:hypothetical protein
MNIVDYLRESVDNADLSAARLSCFHIVRNNWIIPLLREIQDPGSSIISREFVREIFSLIDSYVELELSSKGWTVAGKGQSVGEYVYRNRCVFQS